jgi:hypothetical protein
VTRESDPPLVISTSAYGEQIFVVSLEGDLDLATAGDLLPMLTGLLDRGKISVIVDVSGLEFIDSSGLSRRTERRSPSPPRRIRSHVSSTSCVSPST